MKIEVRPLKNRTWREIGSSDRSVKEERVRDAQGRAYSRFTVNFGSRSIDADLTYVFGRNVKRARDENRRVIGSSDGVAAGK